MLPQLSRLAIERQMGRFRDELVRGASLMFFVAVPAAVGLAVLARSRLRRASPLARWRTVEGRAMLNYSLVGLSVGVIGECALLLCTYASYARSDVRSPLLAMLIRLSIASCGIGVALTLPLEPVLLLALGLTVSIADLGGAAFLALRLRSALPSGEERLLPSILRSAAAATVAVVPALAVATVLPALLPRVGPLAGVVAGCLLGVLTFLLVQVLLRSPELKLLSEALRRREAVGDA